MRVRRKGPREQCTIGRAERGGQVLCPEVLVVVHSKPASLGIKPHDDITAWFYGALGPLLESDLEDLAQAARTQRQAPEVIVDLVLRTPGGELRLDDCRVGLPVRYVGPAATLEFRVAHPGVARDAQLRLAA